MLPSRLSRLRPMLKFGFVILFLGILFNFVVAPSGAFAGSFGPFGEGEGPDWAVAWIHHMFRGQPLPPKLELNSASFDVLTVGLRQALSLYSMGMLILAGFILFYHLVSIVVDTAQTGIPFGRRMNSVWAPIRLVVAIGLLVPISGGLSSGQYIVIKIAEEGSRLASNAWRTILQTTDASFYGLIIPHAPDIAGLVTNATEMEVCRGLYQQYFSPLQTDASFRIVGNIADVTKIPADRLSGDTWRYSNSLNADVPLCGEYRFNDYKPQGFLSSLDADDIVKIAADLSSFSEMKTVNAMYDARGWAQSEGPALASGNSFYNSPGLHNDFVTEESSLKSSLLSRLQTTLNLGPRLMDSVVGLSTQGGWVAAGLFLPEVVRLQETYGELVDHALPTTQEPVLSHLGSTQQLLGDSLKNQLILQTMSNADSEKIVLFYNRLSHAMAAVHNTLSSYQFANHDVVAPSSFDIRDRLSAATSPDNVFSLFSNAVDAAAVARGVWGVQPSDNDAGYPFLQSTTGSSHNPFAMLAEFGRRQYQLGMYLMGLSGQTMSLPSAIAPALFVGFGGLCFAVGASLLIFVIPFLVFFRFLLAVLAWMLSLFEAVAAIPIVALAHLTPSGEGLSGGVARQSYLLWISLMLRPLLSLMGLVAGLVFFAFAYALLCAALTPFARSAVPITGGLLITMNVALILLFDVMMYALANASFKGIYLLPDQALRWISQFVVAEGGDSSKAPPVVSGPQQGGPTLTALAPAWNRVLSHINIQNPLTSSNAKHITKEKIDVSKRDEDRSAHNLKNALLPVYSEKGDNLTAVGTNPIPDATPEGTLDVTSASNTSQEATTPLSEKAAKTKARSESVLNTVLLRADKKETIDKKPPKDPQKDR